MGQELIAWYFNHSTGVIVVFAICMGILTLFTPVLRGKQGEAAVRRILNRLPKEQYTVFNDVLIADQHNSAQIDHIVVSEYGIFVIETKNYKGWIFGTDQSSQWTQSIYGKKYSFYNPILQNQGHILALSEKLALPNHSFIPAVVFSPRATLKVNSREDVFYTQKLYSFIISHKASRLSPEQAEEVIDVLSAESQHNRAARKEHIKSIQSAIKAENQKIQAGICPRCGGALVPRSGKYGVFLGCSNYPKCRFTKNT